VGGVAGGGAVACPGSVSGCQARVASLRAMAVVAIFFPRRLAMLARGTLRNKTKSLEEALTGHFDDHHGFLCQMMLQRIDGLSAQIQTLDATVEQAVAPFARQVTQLDEIAGVGTTSAQELIAEIGVDMSRFPTAGHLVSWAKFAPIDNSSAGKKKGGSTGKGNPWIAGTPGEIVIGASRTHTFLAGRYRRLARRRGKKRAIVATGNTVLTIAYHLLADPTASYTDLGPAFYDSKTGRQRHAATSSASSSTSPARRSP
jgi:transposase